MTRKNDTRTYMKRYSPESIKVVAKGTNGSKYLFLLFFYGFSEYKYDQKLKVQRLYYRPVRAATGIKVRSEAWVDGNFSPAYFTQDTHAAAKTVTDLHDQKISLFNAYQNAMAASNGRRPSPELILKYFRGRSTSNRPIPLHQYISDYAKRKEAYRTKQRYNTLATIVEIASEVRSSHFRFALDLKGEGPFYVQSFSQNDWDDFARIIRRAERSLPLSYESGGLGALRFGDTPAYKFNTLVKYQKALSATLNEAQRDARIIMDGPTNFKMPKEMRIPKFRLEPSELEAIITARFTNPRLENARQLLVLLSLTGVRVSDLKKVLGAEVHEHHINSITFKAIDIVAQKGNKRIVLPVFGPVEGILCSNNRPKHIAPANLIAYSRELLRELQIDRRLAVESVDAKGKRTVRSLQMWEKYTTHDSRRSFYTLLVSDLRIQRILVSKTTGHSDPTLRGEDLGYYAASPEQSAANLLLDIKGSTHPFAQLLINNVRYTND